LQISFKLLMFLLFFWNCYLKAKLCNVHKKMYKIENINETLKLHELAKKRSKIKTFLSRHIKKEKELKGARWKNVNYNLWTLYVLTVYTVLMYVMVSNAQRSVVGSSCQKLHFSYMLKTVSIHKIMLCLKWS